MKIIHLADAHLDSKMESRNEGRQVCACQMQHSYAFPFSILGNKILKNIQSETISVLIDFLGILPCNRQGTGG